MNFIHRYPWWNSLIFFGSLFHSHSISCPLPTFIMNFNCYLKQYQLYSEYILMEIVSKPNTNYIKRNWCIVLLVRCFFLLKKSLWLIIINLTHMNAQNTHRNTHTLLLFSAHSRNLSHMGGYNWFVVFIFRRRRFRCWYCWCCFRRRRQEYTHHIDWHIPVRQAQTQQ